MRHQRGQVLVIFAGGLVALMAIAALVVDLGFVFMIHRHEQNAADPGALAAARYIRYPGPAADTTRMFQAACFYARQNGYFRLATDNSKPPSTTGCRSANDDMGSTLTVNFPPSTSAGDYAGRPGFVEVVITENHDSFFAGVLGMRKIPVSSGAVAAFSNGDSNSNSIVALDANACPGLQINGSARITIQPTVPGSNGGYIMVDSKCGATGDTTPDACSNGGSGGIDILGGATVTAPAAFVVGRCKSQNAQSFPVDEGAAFYADPLAGLVGPVASGPGAFCQPLGRNLVPGDSGCLYKTAGPFTLSPGVYYGGIDVQTNKPVLNLTPGIYIMAGGGFTPSNGEIDSAAGDIMIYSTDVAAYYGKNCMTTAPAPQANYCQGDIFINGQANINLSGLNLDPCPPISSTGCPYVGILFWQDALASKAASGGVPIITINGGTNLRLAGTIYNSAGDTTLNGGSSTSGCTGANQNCAAVQLISNTIKINGGSGLNMPYDPNKLYHLDNQGLVL